jgi:hypothetical protein
MSRYSEPLSAGSESQRGPGDTLPVLTRPMGRSGDRWLGIQEHQAGLVSASRPQLQLETTHFGPPLPVIQTAGGPPIQPIPT